MEAWRRTFCMSLICPTIRWIPSRSTRQAARGELQTDSLRQCRQLERKARVMPKALSDSAAATNSATPLFHSKRDGSMTIGTPEGSGDGLNTSMSTPEPMMTSVFSSDMRSFNGKVPIIEVLQDGESLRSIQQEPHRVPNCGPKIIALGSWKIRKISKASKRVNNFQWIILAQRCCRREQV